jgi:hypothetical protein
MDRRALDEFIERAAWTHRRRELDAAAVAVIDAFDSRGVESLLLKGPALARLLYDEDGRRGYADIDLLVSTRDLKQAQEALSGLGYLRADYQVAIDDVAGVLHAENWVQSGDTGPLWVDLHWRLWGCGAPDEVVFATLSAPGATIDLAGRDVPVLGIDGLALHLALHAAQSGPHDIKVMADLARGVERLQLEVWRSAARTAGDLAATPAYAAGLRLDPAGTVIAKELELPETDELEWEIRNRSGRPRGRFHLQALAQATGWRERANVLRRSVVPIREWITWEMPWAAKSRPRLLLAYALHILRTPVWAGRAWAFHRRARRPRRRPPPL